MKVKLSDRDLFIVKIGVGDFIIGRSLTPVDVGGNFGGFLEELG